MVGSAGLFGFAGLGLREAVAVAAHLEDVNVMRQTVASCTSQSFEAETAVQHSKARLDVTTV